MSKKARKTMKRGIAQSKKTQKQTPAMKQAKTTAPLSKLMDGDEYDVVELFDDAPSPQQDEATAPQDLQSMTLLELMELCDKSLSDSHLSANHIAKAQPAIHELAQRLSLTEDEALWLASIFNQGGFYNIDLGDLCRYFDCRPIQVLKYKSLFDTLVQKELLRPSRHNKGQYNIPENVVNSIGRNEIPHPAQYTNLSTEQLLDTISDFLDARKGEEFTYDYLEHRITDLFAGNAKLPIVQKINNYFLTSEDRTILLVTLSQFVDSNDERIGMGDLRDIFDRSNKNALRCATSKKGDLFVGGILEFNNNDGLFDSSSWHLSDRTKEELLDGTDYLVIDTNKKPAGLIESSTIKAKQLFYNSQVTQQVKDLCSILSRERFKEVQERLTAKGMRRGFACIFYGAPGTGKTETVLQLGRQTGRDIMQVDMSKLRDAYVGESEKRVKGVFDRYRRLCEKCETTPILLFNEADAILGKRNANAAKAVDKMENAIQNIILQEMENLDGIMIATTNMTSNLDTAFERRFLYKIEFPTPTPNESKHIWQAMLPELSDDNALLLAKRFAFSGGQIENIARKQTVHHILYGETTDLMDSIVESCKQEKLGKSEHSHIGFCE